MRNTSFFVGMIFFGCCCWVCLFIYFVKRKLLQTAPLLVSPFFWPNQEVNAFIIDLLL